VQDEMVGGSVSQMRQGTLFDHTYSSIPNPQIVPPVPSYRSCQALHSAAARPVEFPVQVSAPAAGGSPFRGAGGSLTDPSVSRSGWAGRWWAPKKGSEVRLFKVLKCFTRRTAVVSPDLAVKHHKLALQRQSPLHLHLHG
jgi:hypothetical protein